MSRPRALPIVGAVLALVGVIASVPSFLERSERVHATGTVLALEERHGGSFEVCRGFQSTLQEHWCRAATYAEVEVAEAGVLGGSTVWVNALFDLDEGQPMVVGEQVALACRRGRAGWWCVRGGD